MESILNKHSNLPHEFIEEYYNIAKEPYNDDDLVIDLRIASKWLNESKANLMHLLTNKIFEIKNDYVINNFEEIIVTPLCFKVLCILLKTPRAQRIRLQLISLEALTRKYNQQVIKRLTKRLIILQKDKNSNQADVESN